MRTLVASLAMTMREMVRARIAVVLAVGVALILWASLFAGRLAFESGAAYSVDLGLTLSFFFFALSTILIAHEYVGGAAGAAVAPWIAAGADRTSILIGRWLAALGASLILTVAPVAALFLVLAATHRTPENFPLVANALVLFPMEAMILHALASALTIASRRAIALAAAFGLWIACHLHPDPIIFETEFPAAVGAVLRAVAGLAPDLELYNPILPDAGGFRGAVIQAVGYTAGLAVLTLAFFRKKDL